MIQLNPDTDTKGWDWCSGYHHSDSTIKGFSHTHLSGTGWADLGDILIMPTIGKMKFEAGSKANPDEGYRSKFSHDNEIAKPGYYQVLLKDYNINVELTTSERVGYHKYTFPKSDNANIIIDPTSKIFAKVINTNIKVHSNNEIHGFCHSNGWAGNRHTYFVAKFSKEFNKASITVDNKIVKDCKDKTSNSTKVGLNFSTKKDEVITVKFAYSNTSLENAIKNLNSENLKFKEALKLAQNKWQDKLSKIAIKGGTEEQKTIFATAMYHSFIAPNLYMDVDGSYYSHGKNVKAKGFNNYSTFSIWDTYRATHPLFTIIDTKTTADFANSLMSRYFDAKIPMPRWELMGYDNRCMIGYHSVSVIWDAIQKGVKGIDKEKALEAMIAISNFPKPSDSDGESGLLEAIKLGYMPQKFGKSVSKTLENAYDDWCIAKLAEQLGKKEIAKEYYKRSNYFENLFHPEKKYFWAKDEKGNWVNDFPLTSWDDLQKHYISGNLWAYEYYVPHNMTRFIELKGGQKAFAKSLDHLISTELEMEGDLHVDLSGFIGMYGHGDEPGHHIPYLYNYVGEAWKTQKLVDRVCREMYSDKIDGMINNEDCGQMSSWYIFSAMGFYPVCPGDGQYIIGAPLFDEVAINLENGKQFKVIAKNQSAKNIYIKSIKLNGKPYTKTYLQHKDIMKGGTIEFEMSATPNKELGSKKADMPV
jgi:predicted alpha-1,2-mannosidase